MSLRNCLEHLAGTGSWPDTSATIFCGSNPGEYGGGGGLVRPAADAEVAGMSVGSKELVLLLGPLPEEDPRENRW